MRIYLTVALDVPMSQLDAHDVQQEAFARRAHRMLEDDLAPHDITVVSVEASEVR